MNSRYKIYDIVFITNQPAFYKVRQWNEIAKKKRVLVIFLNYMESDRNEDFVSEEPEFEFKVLPAGVINSICYLLILINKIKYNLLIIGGWDNVRLRILPFLSCKRKNALLCESSIYEYHNNYVKDLVKRIILYRISRVYPSGIAQERVFEHLGFKGELILTGGCGILNYIKQPYYQSRAKVKSFLYVGRLVEEKNLKLLVSVFNELPDMDLDIIGYGQQEEVLKDLAKGNIHFIGVVENKKLTKYYQQADVFVLPSIIEPWGLVIEEALNNGTPVIVSDKVGCREDLVTEETGLVFDSNSEQSLREAINKIVDIDFYNSLRYNISKLDFEDRRQHQIDVFSR